MGTISLEDIDTTVMYRWPVEELFMKFVTDRCLIQFIDLPQSVDRDDIMSERESHCAVIKNIKGEYWLFDHTNTAPYNLSKEKKFAIRWIRDIEYIDIYKMHPT